MARQTLRVIVVFAALLGAAAVADGRQAKAPTDAEVQQLRAKLKEIEAAGPPPGQEAQFPRDLAEMRLALRDKLLAQRTALAAYAERVRGTLSADRVRQIDEDLRKKQSEIDEAQATLLSGFTGQSGAGPTSGGAASTNVGGQGASPDTAANTPPSARTAAKPLPARASSEAVASGAEAAGPADQLSSCADINKDNVRQFSQYEVAICDLVNGINVLKAGVVSNDPEVTPLPPNPSAAIVLAQHQFHLQKIFAAKLIGTEERGKFLVEAEEARTDKQVEGGPENAGSTSLVVKGGAPTVFGFAVSNGALVQSRSGTTFTFRGNPIGIAKLLQNKTFDESYLEDEKDPVTRFLKKTSFSVSFDTDRGDEPGVFTGDTQQLSAWSVRHEFVNERDPRHRKHQQALAGFLAGPGSNIAQAVFDTFMALIEDVGGRGTDPLTGNRFKDPIIQAWYEETNRRIAAAAPGDVEAVVKERLAEFPSNDDLSSSTRDAVGSFANNFSGYLEARRKLLDEIAKGKVITFEYTNNREVNTPDTSNFRFIAETGVFGGKADLTGNASFTIHNSRPAGGEGRVRDFQFAGQFDLPFKVERVGSFVFSFAGKYERLMGDATALDGTVLPGTKGDIAVGQFKLEVPFVGGMRLPLSLTFANRTELVRESEVRGNFGFTFDMDKILARFKPF